MMRCLTALLGTLILTLASAAEMQDRLLVEYIHGYPQLLLSDQTVVISIVRDRGDMIEGDLDIDQLFEAVSDVLEDYDVSRSWAFLHPDAPFIRITVSFDGEQWRLISDTAPALVREDLKPDDMDDDLRHQVAFEKIRLLAHAYVQKQLVRP